MHDHPIQARLAVALRSLAECQLQGQISRSAALDSGAVGVMGVDAALAAVAIGLPSAHRLGLAALVLLAVSLVIAMAALLAVGATDMGPMIGEVMSDRGRCSDAEIELELLHDLGARVIANQRALDRKEKQLTAALALILVSILIQLMGQVQ